MLTDRERGRREREIAKRAAHALGYFSRIDCLCRHDSELVAVQTTLAFCPLCSHMVTKEGVVTCHPPKEFKINP